jgi:hypothetical protein
MVNRELYEHTERGRFAQLLDSTEDQLGLPRWVLPFWVFGLVAFFGWLAWQLLPMVQGDLRALLDLLRRAS